VTQDHEPRQIWDVVGKASTSPARAGVALMLAAFLHQPCHHCSGAILPDGFVDEHVVTLQEAVGLTFGRDGRVWVWERAGRILDDREWCQKLDTYFRH
jgi:hypothetical protein